MDFLDYRKKYNLTQKAASTIAGIPLRTYIRYESDSTYGDSIKRQAILKKFEEKYTITEERGILSREQIISAVTDVVSRHSDEIDFCYLFGSYAKGYAKDASDVDLMVSTSLTGLSFVGLSEELHIALNKKVDILRFSDLKDKMEIIREILKDGVKIYG
ncbi:MAG: nucleotidyltransferase domain-containing protein [Lachnospiraceae bacterium]|nr:nucleotidyltransferase domain-containing protein [Lachnospiraceae bacterium]